MQKKKEIVREGTNKSKHFSIISLFVLYLMVVDGFVTPDPPVCDLAELLNYLAL